MSDARTYECWSSSVSCGRCCVQTRYLDMFVWPFISKFVSSLNITRRKKIIIVSCIQRQICSQLFLTDLYFFWFFGSPFQVGETGKRKKVIFFSHSRQDIATLPLQCMVVAALSSGKLVLRRSDCRGNCKAKFCLLCIFVKIFWLSVYRLTCITVSSWRNSAML